MDMAMLGAILGVLTPACAASGEPVVVQETVVEHPWRYGTENPKQVYFFLSSGERPFLGGDGDRLGYFTYDWEAAFGVDEASGTVERACVVTQYQMHYPYMPTPTLKRCFGTLTDAVEAHEREHVAITRAVIRHQAESVIGLPVAEAEASMASLDEAIPAANEAFHASPEGRTKPKVRKRRGC